MARSTAAAGSWRPLTTKCMPMRVNTFGSVCPARSALSLTWQPRTSCRPRLRISTTS
jgi:hypothetical protein